MEKATEKLAFIITADGFRVDEAVPVTGKTAEQWKQRFQKAPYETLYSLAFQERPACFDSAGSYLCLVAERFAEELAAVPGLELSREDTRLRPGDESAEQLLDAVPFALGSEYVTRNWLRKQYTRLLNVFRREIAAYPGKVSLYLSEKSQKLQVPERIFFHLVESGEGDAPFAFLATYATKAETGRVRHMPLQYALTEYHAERQKLLELLSCLNQAAEVSPLIAGFVESGELFHPLRMSAEEAYNFLQAVPELERVGILCRIPNWWRKRSSAVSVSVKIGDDEPSLLGMESILSMVPSLTVGGVPLTEEDIRLLMQQTEGLAFIKGRWIEVDHGRLQDLLRIMEQNRGEMTLLQALRKGLMADSRGEDREIDVGPIITNGKWLGGLLQTLRNPTRLKNVPVPERFNGTLRPYQDTGYNWLLQMDKLGFGACLADDMGLGKTVQILAYLEKLRSEKPDGRALLVVPASLLGNWQKEAEKFAPDLSMELLHGAPAETLRQRAKESTAFLTLTSYRMAATLEPLRSRTWDCMILDEAQAIKNPSTMQTVSLKKFKSRMRIAMTGTPIENDLSNLWSLFDFLDKGLLGSSDQFRRFCKGLEERPEGYAKLKNMIAPFLLRRVKTDKRIITDLPDKQEQIDYVELSKKQTVLYRKLLADTQAAVLESTGMQRRGLVLSLILHLKQICNHPDQYLGQKEYSPSQSGKFEMLRELAETIYEKRERVLVFTQFKELTDALDDYLAEIFHCRGGVIHGGVPVKERNQIVERFQAEEYMPYLVLSVRAGGTGLNLTKANHVIHFDRWWNPSVENQATDRAFRIGQDKNVMVHKFVSRGSVEEKIDALIESKKDLAENVIGTGGENWITELSNEELLSILRLD
jgi:non-specific serine/threonine protein kinase